MANEPSLSRLFEPRAVAVVGATNTPGKIGRIIFENLLAYGRPVHPVHPTEEAVLGRAATARVEDLPDDVDVAVIALGAERATSAAEACGARGIPFIIPVAGGFAEAGDDGKTLEARLSALRLQYGSRVLGPNTLGVLVPDAKLDTIFVDHPSDALAPNGAVAFVTQSGSVGTEALAVACNIGFGLRAFAGLGNKCDLDEIELVDHFGADEGTRCVALYLETFADGRAFLEAARRASRRKPVVALKAGRTPPGAAAVSLHTGRLAGSDRVVSGALRQYGVQRAADEEHLFDAARALSRAPIPRGPRVAVVTPGGGYGVMATDEIDAADTWPHLEMARLGEAAAARIRAAAPTFACASNPVDVTASADDDLILEALEAVLADDGVDMVLGIALFAPPGITGALIERIAALGRDAEKPLVLLVQHGAKTEATLRRLFAAGTVGFPSTRRAVRALRCLWERALLLAREDAR